MPTPAAFNFCTYVVYVHSLIAEGVQVQVG
jgi:hypothetical protein